MDPIPFAAGALVTFAFLAYTVFHYGVSAWGGYLGIGLPVAYFAYRHDAPFRVSTAL